MLPAWVSEPAPAERYAQHQGEDRADGRPRDRRPRDKRGPDRQRPRPSFDRPTSKGKTPDRPRRHDRRPPRAQDRHRKDRHPAVERPLPPIAVKFLPRVSAFENVVAQIKSGSVAYSLFALARLFLEKATRHDVQLTALPESPLFQLGENGDVSVDRQFLERNAFRFAKADFYKVDVTETEPIKGNFTNVARCRLSGTLPALIIVMIGRAEQCAAQPAARYVGKVSLDRLRLGDIDLVKVGFRQTKRVAFEKLS